MTLLIVALLIIALCLLAMVCWNVVAWPKVSSVVPEETGPSHLERLAVLIPARDEELNLALCLKTVLAQGEIVREVLIYDDHSTDRTSKIIEQYARLDRRVRLIESTKLPAGWCGKNYACARLAEAAQSEWLLFLDADARLADNSALRMLLEAERRQSTMLSCWPDFEMGSFWEKALMPLLNFLVLTLYPAPLSLKRNDASLGLAHGACMLLHRETYKKVGGHAIIRGEIIEDIRLSRLWRERGERSVCLDGVGAVRVRMYRSLAEIWHGFRKNFYPGFRHSSSFWAFLALHFTVFLLPFLLLAPLLLMNDGTSGLVLIGVCACVLVMRLMLMLRFRQEAALWSVLLHPLSETVLIALGLTSWWFCRSGRGVEWKGRRYRTSVEL